MKRNLRVNQLIKKELSQILLREVDFPERVLVTVTRVECSAGLSQAKVYISSLPKDKIQDILQILNKLIFFLQQKLNKRLKMRPIPKIIFAEEEKTKEAGRVEELLENIHEENSKSAIRNSKHEFRIL